MSSKKTPHVVMPSVLRLVEGTGTTVSISVRIPDALHQRIEHVRIGAKQNGYTFDVSEIVRTALTGACNAADSELRTIAAQAAKRSAQQAV